MQVALFNFYTHIGLIVVHGSTQAIYLVKDDEIHDKKNFTQFQPDRIVLCMIVNGRDTQFDIRIDEIVPATGKVLLEIQTPFLVKGDLISHEGVRGVQIEDPCEENKIVDIPPGNYLLTIHQCYSGDKPLGPPHNPAAIPVIEQIRWDKVPICMRMYFNPVNSLDDVVALEHWNWPGNNA